MDGGFALSIFNYMISTLGGFVDSTYGVIMGSWPGKVIATLYVVIVGYLVIMGRAGERSKSWAVSAFLLVIIGGIAAKQGAYSSWIGGPIYDMAYKFAALPTEETGGVGGLLRAIEQAVGRTFATIDNLELPGNFLTEAWLYIKVGVAVMILALLACALYLETLALLCIAFFSVFMMILAGGPCLWLASFKETRFITWAWLRATANYVLWVFFISSVAAIGIKFVGLAVEDLLSWDLERDGVFTKAVGSAMLLMALTCYMMLKAADWAAALTGGTASQTGVIGAMGSVAGGAVGGVINAAGSAAGGAARWAGGALVNHTSAGAAAYRAYSAIRGIGTTK